MGGVGVGGKVEGSRSRTIMAAIAKAAVQCQGARVEHLHEYCPLWHAAGSWLQRMGAGQWLRKE